jgi:hypothetical protein
MATNSFLEFDYGRNNIGSSSTYDTLRATGFVRGKASAAMFNRVLQQVSVMVAALGEAFKNKGYDMTPYGTYSTLVATLQNMVLLPELQASYSTTVAMNAAISACLQGTDSIIPAGDWKGPYGTQTWVLAQIRDAIAGSESGVTLYQVDQEIERLVNVPAGYLKDYALQTWVTNTAIPAAITNDSLAGASNVKAPTQYAVIQYLTSTYLSTIDGRVSLMLPNTALTDAETDAVKGATRLQIVTYILGKINSVTAFSPTGTKVPTEKIIYDYWNPRVSAKADAAEVGTLLSGKLSKTSDIATNAYDSTQVDKWLSPKVLVNSFTSSRGSGYQKLPGGLVLIWGSFMINKADELQEKPVSFPTIPGGLTACYSVVLSGNVFETADSNDWAGIAVASINTSGFVYCWGARGTAGSPPTNWFKYTTIYYMAIGLSAS